MTVAQLMERLLVEFPSWSNEQAYLAASRVCETADRMVFQLAVERGFALADRAPCHDLDELGRPLCGGSLTAPAYAEHDAADCGREGHETCATCESLWELEERLSE